MFRRIVRKIISLGKMLGDTTGAETISNVYVNANAIFVTKIKIKNGVNNRTFDICTPMYNVISNAISTFFHHY